jgi:hypothetical protein
VLRDQLHQRFSNFSVYRKYHRETPVAIGRDYRSRYKVAIANTRHWRASSRCELVGALLRLSTWSELTQHCVVYFERVRAAATPWDTPGVWPFRKLEYIALLRVMPSGEHKILRADSGTNKSKAVDALQLMQHYVLANIAFPNPIDDERHDRTSPIKLLKSLNGAAEHKISVLLVVLQREAHALSA